MKESNTCENDVGAIDVGVMVVVVVVVAVVAVVLVVLVVVVVVVVVMVVVMGDKHFYTKGREFLYVGIGDGDEEIAGGENF